MENYRKQLDALCQSMMAYDAGDAARIQHFIKVHSFAGLIGRMEGLPQEQLVILEAAAYVHDIGIKPSEARYGDCSGTHQEELGPAPAREMLGQCGFTQQQTERVAYLVGHHHTYTDIDGADYQILVEADFLVNLHEGNSSADAVRHAYETIFRTESGRDLCRKMFGL
ncbi:MAG: HD domain-containing protein [Roseburia sp.]|nr:HD domain-containing protein [Roseburia sp.]